jgi:hypothetical protein
VEATHRTSGKYPEYSCKESDPVGQAGKYLGGKLPSVPKSGQLPRICVYRIRAEKSHNKWCVSREEIQIDHATGSCTMKLYLACVAYRTSTIALQGVCSRCTIS